MKKGLKQRDWNEIKTNDSWSIFKIMGEFVQGFETLQRIGPCVSIMDRQEWRKTQRCTTNPGKSPVN